MSMKFLKMLHTLYIILLEIHEKKIIDVIGKASGTSDVRSSRQIVLPINSSLIELTSEVPEIFPYH